MGTWDSGNFCNDCACDLRAHFVDELLALAQPPERVGHIDLLMAAVEMIAAVCQRCGIPAQMFSFDLKTLWSEVLRVYDEQSDSSADPTYQLERREVIDRTFRELHSLISNARKFT